MSDPARLGQLPLFKEIAREAKKRAVTPGKQRLKEVGDLIHEEPPGRNDIGYMHVVLCHLNMPRSKPKERTFERIYERPAFRYYLRMEGGTLFDGTQGKEYPLPYGPKPRDAFMDIVTAACKTGERTVDCKRSTREYMLHLGIDPQGSQYKRFQYQMQALAACHMQLGLAYPGGRVVNIKAPPIEKFEAWLTHDDTGQKALWPGSITLSQQFFDGLQENLVPTDRRASFALQGALEKDIYFWLAQRLCRIDKPNGQFISWYALKDQFAPDYKHIRNFRQEFLDALGKVREVYRDARVAPVIDSRGQPRGLHFYPAPPPIPKTLVSVPALPTA